MSTEAAATIDQAKEYKLKLKLVEFKEAPKSQLPHCLIKRKTGVTLGRFATLLEAEKFLETYSLEHLRAKPTRRRR